jgi:hypothetical protein
MCILLAASTVLATSTFAASQMASPAAENYQVYSASLPFGYHTQGLDVAIRSKTIAVPDLANAAGAVQQEFAAMQADPEVAAAIRQMQTAKPGQPLLPRFAPANAIKVELLNQGVFGKKVGWKEFNQAHKEADGLTELSAVGFNPAHTVAVFYAAHRAGTGCSDEGFEVLRKSKGRWRRQTDKGFSFAACN